MPHPLYPIQSCVKTRHVGALILFDIQGFFDNLHVDCLAHLVTSLGFAPSLCQWVQSFLTNCQVTMSINRETSPEMVLNHRTPQGSPLSPLLSTIYLIPLLCLTEEWKFYGLLTYVDDRAIFATGPTHKIATNCAASTLCSISFQPPHISTRHIGHQISNLTLGLPGSWVLSVWWSNSVQYLGIYLQHNLCWDSHTKTMAAWACSTIHALQLLGNSV